MELLITMGGQPLRIEKVKKVEAESRENHNQIEKQNNGKKESPKVIPLRRKTT